jgi:hypothetical protein
MGHVTRSRQVSVAYQDLNGTPQTIEFYGNPAIIFQHEYDHLEGVRPITLLALLSESFILQVLFVDHFDDSDQRAAKERLSLLSKVHRNIS